MQSTNWESPPCVGDWLRGPGDKFEIDRMVVKYDIRFENVEDAVTQAKGHIRDATADPDYSEDTDAQMNYARLLLWLAGSMGYLKACAMLVSEIRVFVKLSFLADSEAEYYLQIASGWETRAGPECDREQVLPENLPMKIDLKKLKRLQAVEENLLGQEFSSVTVPGSRVVVPMIGDILSTEGLALKKRFGAIVGVPLPPKSVMPDEGMFVEKLTAEWPWAKHVAHRLENVFALQRSVRTSQPKVKPMIFVGPPGSGKTALARRVAEMLGVPALVIPAGGASDTAGLSSITRGWNSSRPCGPVIAAAHYGCCDPAIIVDELDKTVAADGKNGSAAGTLLGMLGDPRGFYDSCLLTEVDLSSMFFMATANDLTSIPEALLDRFTVLIVGRPKEEDFDTVLRGMRKAAGANLNVHPELLPTLDGDEYGALKRFFAESQGSLRAFSRAYEVMLSEALQRESTMMPTLS